MPPIDLDMARWLALDAAAARRLSAEVADDTGTELVALHPHPLAGGAGRVAMYRCDGELYALVPGGEVTLGYDGACFTPSQAQAAEHAATAADHGLPADLRAHVDELTSAPRTATVPALLVAVEAVEAGLVSVPADDPRVAPYVAEALGGRRATRPRQVEWDGRARVRLGPDGEVDAAWLIDVPGHDEEVERLALLGLRLLTPDEWEHACGAGASTLFRWGDDCPTDRSPSGDDDLPHRVPNAFGLSIGQDPYRWERTADPMVACGGDGGTEACGGGSYFREWLTLATAYRNRELAAWHAEQGVQAGFVRPALPLG